MHASQRAAILPFQPARESHSVRLITLLTAVLAIAGMLLLARSEVAAQSAERGSEDGAGAPAGNAQHGQDSLRDATAATNAMAWRRKAERARVRSSGLIPIPYAAFSLPGPFSARRDAAVHG